MRCWTTLNRDDHAAPPLSERSCLATVLGVSTSVVLSVTPREAVHPDCYTGDVPDEVAAALTAAGQPADPGLWCPAHGPVRLLFQLSGPDRIAAGRRLLDELRLMGYEVDLSFSP